MEELFLWKNRDSLDFDEEFGPKQPRHLNCGAHRRILQVDISVAHLPEFGQAGEIEKIAIQLDHVVKVPSSSLNGSLEIFKYLLKLHAAVVFAYDAARLIEGNLTSDEYHRAPGHARDLRITYGLRHIVWDQYWALLSADISLLASSCRFCWSALQRWRQASYG